MAHILTGATFGVVMGEEFCAKPGELPSDASTGPLFWMVAEGCGGWKVGRSGNDGSVVSFVMRLQSKLYEYIESLRVDPTIT